MERIKTDEVYVVNQPKHAIISIIFIENPIANLDELYHNQIFKLAENTDVIFIFKSIKGVNPDIFAKLYGACSWIISADSLVRTYLKTIRYSVVIFKNLVGILTFDLKWGLPNNLDITTISAVAGSNIAWPIFPAAHLSSKEMKEIYTIEDEPQLRLLFRKEKKARRNEYSTWKLTSNTVFFRPRLLERFETLSNEYIESFGWDDIGYFIASACEYLGIKRLDFNMFNVNLHQLNNYAIDSEGKE